MTTGILIKLQLYIEVTYFLTQLCTRFTTKSHFKLEDHWKRLKAGEGIEPSMG